MHVVTHCIMSGDAPPDHAWIAAFYRDGERLPLVFNGATEAVAIGKAIAWLDVEDAKVEGQKAFRESLSERMTERAANRRAKKERTA